MDIRTNIPLKNYLTMRLGGQTRFMAVAHSAEDVASLCKNARAQGLNIFILGGGSNSLAKDTGFDGIVIRNSIKGVTVVAEDSSSTTIQFGAGELWDDAVKLTVDRSLSGMEALSAIPGTVGAAPVQNIGAYGQEVADTFVSLDAYDIATDQFVILNADQCQFAYRHSIFRGESSGRYVITSVTFKLYKTVPSPPFYKALQDYFDAHNTTLFTPDVIRQAVIDIRKEKLPDPVERPNTGSFFKNAIIELWQRDELLKEYPDMPSYDLGDKTFKIPTGWLVEQTGLKGSLLHGMRIHDKNALVLINESATSYEDLAAARSEIIGAVRDKFRITIEQEPLEL
jgi:UDP-N-acetylmuramate dehydrogenase